MRRRTMLLVIFPLCLLILVFILGIGLLLKTSDIPFIQALFTPVQSSMLKIFHSSIPTTQMDRLKAENTTLLKQLASLKAVEADNKALRDQFQTTTPPSQTLMPALIIGMPGLFPGSVPDSLIIAQGAKDGVKVGQAVVYKNELLGTVTSTHSNVAKIQMITAGSVSFPAKTSSTNALGIVKGLGNGQVEFDNVVLSDKLTVGDLVVSGPDEGENGSGIPPGLVIGKITSVDKKSSNLFQKANLQILTDITRLSDVFLVISQ